MFTVEDFDFLAFNKNSGAILAHGKTAAHAVLYADEVAPYSDIDVVYSGRAGLRIWHYHMAIKTARWVIKEFQKKLTVFDSPKNRVNKLNLKLQKKS